MRKRDEGKMTEYEKQRMNRIQQNRSRMEALGIPTIASSLLLSSQQKREPNLKENNKTTHKNHKRAAAADDDDDYMPNVVEEETDDDEDSPTPKRKKKILTPKKKVQVQKHKKNSDFDDEDEAFLQAIALSLKEKEFSQIEGCSGISKSSGPRLADGKPRETKGNACIQEESGTRKRKKQVSSRVQMTEDELIVHFFQLDEGGKGSINVNDLEIMAAIHDFTWTDKELSDMIHCFNSNGEGKLSLDDFRKIVRRCNMIQSSERA